VFPKIPFDCTPKEFDEVKLTVIFGKEDAPVTKPLNRLLNKGFLLEEIGLIGKDCTAATKVGAIACTSVTFHLE
jgi:hypothetical protein